MGTPYRSECSRCAELASSVDVLSAANETLRMEASTARSARVVESLGKAFAIGGVVGAAVLAGFFVHGQAMKPAGPPDPCHDSIEIIDYRVSMRDCSPGASVTTEVVPGSEQKVMVKCMCARHVTSDAGVDNAAP